MNDKTKGCIEGVIFAVSNDGGKTGVAWRNNVFEALEYLELQNKNGGDYAVVVVKKQEHHGDVTSQQ